MNVLPTSTFIPEDFLHRTRFLWHGNNPSCISQWQQARDQLLNAWPDVAGTSAQGGESRGWKGEPWNQIPIAHQWSWDTAQHFIPLAICFSFVSPLSYWCGQLEISASINNPFVWPFMHSSSTTERMNLLQIKMHRGWSVEQFKSEWLT